MSINSCLLCEKSSQLENLLYPYKKTDISKLTISEDKNSVTIEYNLKLICKCDRFFHQNCWKALEPQKKIPFLKKTVCCQKSIEDRIFYNTKNISTLHNIYEIKDLDMNLLTDIVDFIFEKKISGKILNDIIVEIRNKKRLRQINTYISGKVNATPMDEVMNRTFENLQNVRNEFENLFKNTGNNNPNNEECIIL
jgi:hypothetical protein